MVAAGFEGSVAVSIVSDGWNSSPVSFLSAEFAESFDGDEVGVVDDGSWRRMSL